MTYTLKELKDENMIIFSSIMGSRAYGTFLPTSDTDIRGIFIQPLKDILKYGYVEQVADLKNDIVFYELKRFMELVESNNPNILELLNAPEDCIITKTFSYDPIFNNKDQFLSKICKNSFGGYAIAQIKKARGLKKKMNWDENEMVRKTVLDFCYILDNGGSKPFRKWIKENHFEGTPDWIEKWTHKLQGDYALSKIPHARDLYALYDLSSVIEAQGYDEHCYGIVKDEEASNDVRTTSIPKGEIPIAHLSFNKDGYSTHCKLYSEYQTWLKNRNEDRFKMNKSHGKNYDSKNMMHTFRLLNMAIEIAAEHKIKVRRDKDEIIELMKIRRGEMEYDNLLDEAEKLILKMNQYFEESSLPMTPNQNLIKDLQYNIRKEFYKFTGQLYIKLFD